MATDNLFSALQGFLGRNTDPAKTEKELWTKFGRTCALLVLDSAGFTRTTKERGIVHMLAEAVEKRVFTQQVIRPFIKFTV